MICELCGKPVTEGFRVRVEGSVVTACGGCAGVGEVVQEVKPAKAVKPKPILTQEAKPEFKVEVEYDLVDDYGVRIRAAREKLGWTQDDLGKAVNETHSVIHRIEAGRFEPSTDVARRLEHRLGVKLLVPHEEVEAPQQKQESKDVTLGDMVVVRKRGG
jgi:uncharacterized protein (TIGR00270 family)